MNIHSSTVKSSTLFISKSEVIFNRMQNYYSTPSVALDTKLSTKAKVKGQRNLFGVSSLAKVFPPIFYYSCQGDWIVKTTSEFILPLLTFLKRHTPASYKQLIDISAIDHAKRKLRFEVVYQLLSIIYNNRLSVSISVSEGVSVDSVTTLFSSAGWYERETWDRFGVFFREHPDLRRRLTDYVFKGHPLRKDFPVIGFIEVRYNASSGRVVYANVSLPQEYRIFTLNNNWKNKNQ